MNIHSGSPTNAHLHVLCRKEIASEVPTFTKCILESTMYHRSASGLSFLPLVKDILIYKIGISHISHGFFVLSLTFLFISTF